MKKLMMLSLLIVSSIVSSQEKLKISEPNFESIEITIDTLEEIDAIKWDDFKDVFKENNPESTISIKFTLKNIKKENLVTNFSIGVNGKAEQIDNLIDQLKKGVLKMKQIIINLNYKNNP